MPNNITAVDNHIDFEKPDLQIANLIDHSNYKEQLKNQIEEIEILQSMYYQKNEFSIDSKILSLVESYIEGKSSELPPTIDFIIHLNIDVISLEVQVVLPKLYPTTEPKIFVRSEALVRNQIRLNSDLKVFVKSIEKGTICILEIIMWIINNIDNYKENNLNDHEIYDSGPKENIFVRHWIYSHHIYNKQKRKTILSLAKEYNITGFCLSGKPGIICVEGWENDCNAWWQIIRNLSWKKIVSIKVEQKMIQSNSISFHRKFEEGFTELLFDSMREFHTYLLSHDCSYIFKDFFGFDGENESPSSSSGKI